MSGSAFSRRHLIAAGACWLCAGRRVRAEAPPPCDDLQAAPVVEMSAAERERHTIFLSLAVTLAFDAWTVDRGRPDLVAAYAEAEPGRVFPDYAGHNVGALIVDAEGRVVSLALNRNVALNSTLEHAEARAVRHAIGLANAAAGPAGPKRWSFGGILREHRLYATLEPCVQCAGIMDLANLEQTIFAQEDPAQRHLVDVIYNVQHRAGAAAPLPVAATFFPLWDRLADAHRAFTARARQAGGPSGATAFLETVEAYRVFADGARLFDTLEAREPANARRLDEARALRRGWSAWISNGVGPA